MGFSGRLLMGLALCWVLAGAVAVLAGPPPEALVEVDTTRVTLGDPVRLALKVRYGAGDRPLLEEVDPRSWLEGISYRPGRPLSPAKLHDRLEVVYPFEVRLFELGSRRIPPLTVRFALASGDTLTRETEPVDLEVVPVRGSNDRELRDLKPPVELSGGLPLWLVLVLTVLAAVAGILAWRRFRRRRSAPEPAAPPSVPVDHVAEFVRIAGLGLVERGDYKTYYSLLADNLRRYLEQRLGIPAMELTTAEACERLRPEGLDPGLVDQVREYLELADLVKFARLVPEIDRARRTPEAGIALVHAVDRFWRSREAATTPTETPAAASGVPAAP
jgi:hypothetical protein